MVLPDNTELQVVRGRIRTLLEHLIWLLNARDLPFMPVPYPDDPTGLPPFFPDGECVYTTYIDLGSYNNQRQEYEVKLRHFDPEKDDPFLTWEILISTSTPFGILSTFSRMQQDFGALVTNFNWAVYVSIEYCISIKNQPQSLDPLF